MDKDNREVCSLSATDPHPHPNCGLASALCTRMLPRCLGWAWWNKSCLAGTVVGWLVPMVRAWFKAQARAEGHYRLLSYAGPAAVEQLLAALGSGAASATCSKKEQLGSPLQQWQQQQLQKQWEQILFCHFSFEHSYILKT